LAERPLQALCGGADADPVSCMNTSKTWGASAWATLKRRKADAVFGALFLVLLWQPKPARGDLASLSIVTIGCVSDFSMLVGFIFWYRGLALGGIAGVGQLQSLQPFPACCWPACFCTSLSPGQWLPSPTSSSSALQARFA
jgi:hypothetical protein